MHVSSLWLRLWIALILNHSSSSSTLVCSFDGSFRLATACFSAGISGGGNTFCVYEPHEQLLSIPVRTSTGHSYYFGTDAASSLAAEWMAFIELLYTLRGLKKDCLIFGDSDIVVNSINQSPYVVEFKDAAIMKHYYLACALLHSMVPQPTVKHTPRQYNSHSDWLANEALSARLFQSFIYDNLSNQLTNEKNKAIDSKLKKDDDDTISGTLFIYCDIGNIFSSYVDIYRKMRISVTIKSLNDMTLINRIGVPSSSSSSTMARLERENSLGRNNTFAIDIEHSINTIIYFGLISEVTSMLQPVATACISLLELLSINNKSDVNCLQWRMIDLASAPNADDKDKVKLGYLSSFASIQTLFINTFESNLHRLMYSNTDRDIFILSESLRSSSRRRNMKQCLLKTKLISVCTHNNNINTHDTSNKQFTIFIPELSSSYLDSNIKSSFGATIRWYMTPFQLALLHGNSKIVAFLVSQTGTQCGLINFCHQHSNSPVLCEDELSIASSMPEETVISSRFMGSLHLAVLSGRVGTVSQFLRAVNDQIAIDEYTSIRARRKVQTMANTKINMSRKKLSLSSSSSSMKLLTSSSDSRALDIVSIASEVDDGKKSSMTNEVYMRSSNDSSSWKMIMKTLLEQRNDQGHTALELAELLCQDAMIREIRKFMC